MSTSGANGLPPDSSDEELLPRGDLLVASVALAGIAAALVVVLPTFTATLRIVLGIEPVVLRIPVASASLAFGSLLGTVSATKLMSADCHRRGLTPMSALRARDPVGLMFGSLVTLSALIIAIVIVLSRQ